MKNKFFKIAYVINGLVGLCVFWAVGSGLVQTIVVPDNVDVFSATLLIVSGMPVFVVNVIVHFILKKYIKNKN